MNPSLTPGSCLTSLCVRTKLSKALITDPVKVELRNAADLKIKYGTNLRLGLVSIVLLNKPNYPILNSQHRRSPE